MIIARSRTGVAAALTAVAVVGAGLVTTPTAVAASSAPTLSVAQPLKNEKVSVTGTVPGKRARSVQLQEYSSKKWRTVARTTSSSKGRYRFTRALTTERSVRVYASKKGRLKSFSSSKRTVRLAVDAVSVTVDPADGSVLTTASAPRPGRSVTVQSRTPGGEWQALSTTLVEDAHGQARLSDYPRSTSRQDFRALLGSWNGAPALTQPHGFGSNVDLRPRAPVPLSITTDGGAPIADKETYVRGSLTVGGSSYAMGIRGRGNSTWGAAKKPYRIKLDAKAELLGMPKDKDWVLLANVYDRSLLRNFLALQLGQHTALAWTPRTRFVDLTLNDEPLGSYLLVEHVKIDKNRADESLGSYLLVEHVKIDKNRADVPAGGILLVADVPAPEESTLGVGHHRFAFKDPDPAKVTSEQRSALTADVLALDEALYADGGPQPTWRTMVDQTAAADWYLVNELFKNPDADFYTSVFLAWTPGRFTMGPLWDFDISGGLVRDDVPEAADPTGWYLHDNPVNPMTHWVAKMLDDPAFADLVAERWRALSPVAHAMADQVRPSGTVLSSSATANFDQWADTGTPFPGSRHGTTYDQEIAYLGTWLDRRADWMDSQLN